MADGGISYTWSPQLYITRTSNGKITVRPPQTTTYYVQGKNASGCTGTDSVTVSFIREGDQKLFVPDAFSPNGDGLNEVFRPVFTGPAARYVFSIYNRWGQLIFQSKTPGVGWNGKYRSTLQPKDVYVYYIIAEGGCNGKFEQKGTFVLIR
jgi:gliding motility-associated-like protein